MSFGWGTALLSFLTLQRLAELWWAKRNEAELLASGGVEYGHSHLWLIIAFHSAWMAGLWLLGYDRPVNLAFLILFIVLQIGRFWILLTLGGVGPSASSSFPAHLLWQAVLIGSFATRIMQS
jgi:isoprenylcysteine carboxyl methyltransferase (ICMT) family protein YpbQ